MTLPKKGELLAAIPTGLRGELYKALDNIVVNYRDRRWEPSELNGGKLCEVIYTVLRGHVDGKFPAKAKKPPDMVASCLALAKAGDTFPRSVRIQIPRMIVALYEIRNNRGVGHVGGDVDPNEMDATAVLYMSKWLVAELIRHFHGLAVEDAQQAVETMMERTLPLIWSVAGRHRVLDTSLRTKEKTLILLLQRGGGPVAESDLCDWVEHPSPTVFRRDILKTAHDAKLIEYDRTQGLVWLSPKGTELVEKLLAPEREN
jgi:hypothetical protein